MAQVKEKKSIEKNCIDVEKVILEMHPKQEASNQIIKAEKKPFKTGILKLLKNAELNAKYLEETIPIKKVDYQQYWKIYGLY